MKKVFTALITLCLMLFSVCGAYADEILPEETSTEITSETPSEPQSENHSEEPSEPQSESHSEEPSEPQSESPSETQPEICGHAFGDWRTVNKPTYREDGLEKRVCTLCGETQTRKINKLTHLSYRLCPDGDADMDGKVSAADARYILRLSVGFDDGLDALQKKKADFDKKNGVTAADARYVLRVCVGLDPYAPSLKTGYTFSGYTKKGYALAKKDGLTYVVSPYGYTLIANKTYGLPSSYAPGGLTSECASAFNTLVKAAAREGRTIYLSSGYRSYSTQASLYNRYCARDGRAAADTYSARPGHSEHQTGLAIDVNSITRSFANTKEGLWLASNAHKYGFIIRYPKNKESITGYSYEPWHIRYVGKELAAAVYSSGLCLEEFFGITSVYS